MPESPACNRDGFDVVGDVHGCCRELVELLVGLGYSDESGAFRHPSRQVIFVGDLIDRGPQQVQVLRTVRAMSFLDPDGHERFVARFRWWDQRARSYAQACEVPDASTLPDDPVERPPVEPYRDEVPVIFGHYWRTWPDFELTTTTACVDYSAVKGGPLVAYRWTGETELRPENLFPSHS